MPASEARSYSILMDRLEDLVPSLVALRREMKLARPRFVECDVAIFTDPMVRDWRLLGHFLIDRQFVREPASTRRVKQDYLAIQIGTGRAVYYTGFLPGQEETGEVKNFNSFCREFGSGGNYGCHRPGKRTWLADHEYRDENATGLEEPELRMAIRAAIEAALAMPEYIDRS